MTLCVQQIVQDDSKEQCQYGQTLQLQTVDLSIHDCKE